MKPEDGSEVLQALRLVVALVRERELEKARAQVQEARLAFARTSYESRADLIDELNRMRVQVEMQRGAFLAVLERLPPHERASAEAGLWPIVDSLFNEVLAEVSKRKRQASRA